MNMNPTCRIFGAEYPEAEVILRAATAIYAQVIFLPINPPQSPAVLAKAAADRARDFLAALREDQPAKPHEPATIILAKGLK